MAHIRTQIRERFKSVLSAALPNTEYAVFAARQYARNVEPARAIVDMRYLNDQTRDREVMSDARIHIASLYIRVQRAANETLLDNSLDVDEVRVVSAVEAEDWSDLLEEDPELVQVNFSDSADGAFAIAAIVMRYDLEYRILKSDPETRIE